MQKQREKRRKKEGELCQLCTSNKLIRFLDIFFNTLSKTK